MEVNTTWLKGDYSPNKIPRSLFLYLLCLKGHYLAGWSGSMSDIVFTRDPSCTLDHVSVGAFCNMPEV